MKNILKIEILVPKSKFVSFEIENFPNIKTFTKKSKLLYQIECWSRIKPEKLYPHIQVFPKIQRIEIFPKNKN